MQATISLKESYFGFSFQLLEAPKEKEDFKRALQNEKKLDSFEVGLKNEVGLKKIRDEYLHELKQSTFNLIYYRNIKIFYFVFLSALAISIALLLAFPVSPTITCVVMSSLTIIGLKLSSIVFDENNTWSDVNKAIEDLSPKLDAKMIEIADPHQISNHGTSQRQSDNSGPNHINLKSHGKENVHSNTPSYYKSFFPTSESAKSLCYGRDEVIDSSAAPTALASSY